MRLTSRARSTGRAMRVPLIYVALIAMALSLATMNTAGAADRSAGSLKTSEKSEPTLADLLSDFGTNADESETVISEKKLATPDTPPLSIQEVAPDRAETEAQAPPAPPAPICIDYPVVDPADYHYTNGAEIIDLRGTGSLTNNNWGQYTTNNFFEAVTPPGNYFDASATRNIASYDTFVWYAGNILGADLDNLPGDPFAPDTTSIYPTPVENSLNSPGVAEVEVCADYHYIFIETENLQGGGSQGDLQVSSFTKLAYINEQLVSEPYFTELLRYVEKYRDLDQCLEHTPDPEPVALAEQESLLATEQGMCFSVFEDGGSVLDWLDDYTTSGPTPTPTPFVLPTPTPGPWWSYLTATEAHSDLDDYGIGFENGEYTCWGMPATYVGTAGTDIYLGTTGDDVIVGLGGDDLLYGGFGHDFICGGAGVDTIRGGSGQDKIHGGDDGDKIYGDESSDSLIGGRGDDRIRGGARLDVIFAGSGDDSITGDENDDQIFGGAGNDTIEGNAGDDEIWGGDDFDWAHGGTGIDDCYAVEDRKSCDAL